MVQCYKCVCTVLKECRLRGNYHLISSSRKSLGRNWWAGMRLEKWVDCPCQTSWIILIKHKTSLCQLKSVYLCVYVYMCIFIYICIYFSHIWLVSKVAGIIDRNPGIKTRKPEFTSQLCILPVFRPSSHQLLQDYRIRKTKSQKWPRATSSSQRWENYS